PRRYTSRPTRFHAGIAPSRKKISRTAGFGYDECLATGQSPTCRALAMHRPLFAASIFLLGFATACRAEDKLPTDAGVRKAIVKALPFVEKDGLAWIDRRDCMSCHVVGYMLWAHVEAKAHGIPIDEKKFAEWTDWCMKKSMTQRVFYKLDEKGADSFPDLKEKLAKVVGEGFTHESEFVAALGKALSPEERKEHEAALVKKATVTKRDGTNDGGSPETMSQLYLSRDPSAKDPHAEFYAGLAELTLRHQLPAGGWKAAGQLPGRRWSRP